MTGLGDIVDSSDLTKGGEEVLNDDMLLPAGGEVIRLNQDLVGDGVGGQVREALEDVDGAAIDDHHLVDNLPGNRLLAKVDNTRALAANILDAVHLAKRGEEGGDIFLRETGWFSALDGEVHFARGSMENRGQLSIKTGEKIASDERHGAADVLPLVDGGTMLPQQIEALFKYLVEREIFFI